MKTLILSTIQFLAGLIFGKDANGISIFDRIVGVVRRWGEQQVPGAAKRYGAMQEIASLDGFALNENQTRLGVEIALLSERLRG